MSAPPPPPALRRPSRLRVPGAVLALSLLVTGTATGLFAQSVRARDEARFAVAVHNTAEQLAHRLDGATALLRGGAGLYAAQEGQVDLAAFRAYVRRLQQETYLPGIQGVGFTQRFPTAERAALEAHMRQEEGLADFRAWPPSAGPEQHSILFLEPLDARNRAALGYDMYSEPVRREAMARARDTGAPALTARVTLKQEIDADQQAGFLLYLPVYRSGDVPPTVEARRAALLGFVYIPFRAGDLLEGTFGGGGPSRVAFTLDDGEGSDPARRLYASHGVELTAKARHRQTVPLVVAGRPWTLQVASLPAFEESSARALVWPLLALGLMVSAALSLLALGQARARAASESRAVELAHALSAQARVEAELREADRRKDEFLAMLAHELRNPLAPILSAAQLMERKLAAGREVERERQVVHRQVLHLSRLVDDLLDVSRVTRGKVQLQREPLRLSLAVERALEAVRPKAEARRHRVELQPAPASLWVEADPVRLEQVLTNLLHNAVKYTEPGGHITVRLAQQEGEALVQVRDTGVGISPEALPDLFEPFVQLQHTLDRAQGGLGLGLTLVRALVQMHGGRVEAHSEGPGRGSTFTVHLPLLRAEPLAPAPEAAATSAPPVEGKGGPLRVLVVDDNVDAAEAIAEGLSFDGHQVALAHDGAQALAQAERQRPHAIFLDIGLPVLDGLEVARRLRAHSTLKDCLLVALTGYGQQSDRAATHEAGFDVHLVKPAPLDSVRATLSQVSPSP